MNGVISGRVLDKTGATVQGATVAVTSSPGPVSDIAAQTDTAGRFRLGNLEPGPYTLAVHKTGHAPHTVNVDVADGQQANLEIRLGDQQVIGNVPQAVLEVQLETSNIDWSQVRLVRVALDYAAPDPADATGKDFVLTSTNRDAASWQVPLRDSTRDQYTYKVEYFMADGTRKIVSPTPTNNRTLVLGPKS